MIEDKDIQVTPGASVESAGRRGMAPVDVPTGVKVTHIRTGLVAFCDHERSQLKNLNVCKAMIEAGLVAAGWLVRPNKNRGKRTVCPRCESNANYFSDL